MIWRWLGVVADALWLIAVGLVLLALIDLVLGVLL